MASSSTGSIKLASSSPRFDTLTRFDPGHMRRRSFGAGRKDGDLKALICSGDANTFYVVRGFLKQHFHLAPCLVEAIIQPKVAKDCPVSAALTEQEKAVLRKLAKEASGAPGGVAAQEVCHGNQKPAGFYLT